MTSEAELVKADKPVDPSQRYKSVFESTRNCVIVFRRQGAAARFVVADVNDAALVFLGRPRAAVIGMALPALFPEEMNPGFHNLVDTAWRTGKQLHEPRLACLGGDSPAWRSCSAYRLHTGEVATVSFDVTEHVREERALGESMRRLRRALKAARMGTWEWEPDTGVVQCSDECFELLGLPPEPVKADTLHSLWRRLAQEDRQKVGLAISAASKGLSSVSLECGVEAADGTIRCLAFQGEAVDVDGRRRAVGTVQDVTERKRAEKEANLQRRQLVQADKMASLGILVSGVAHEINNPNHFILMNAELLERIWRGIQPAVRDYYEKRGDFVIAGMNYDELCREIPEILEGVMDGSQRISGIVQELRNFAREIPAEMMQQVDVNDVIRSAVVLVGHMIRKSTHYFEVDCEAGLPAVRGSFQRLEQVVINLMQNACQAVTGADEAISVQTRLDRESGKVVITVADEGQGMDAEVLEHATDPFFTTKRDSGGTGLGLSISASIVAEHQGQLRFESAPGKGTTATIVLAAQPRTGGKD